MNSYSGRNTYTSIRNFGKEADASNHPLTMCLATTMDRRFQNGSAPGVNSGPRSIKCQHYMAQKCADKWDGFCEYFYKEHGKGGQWPNNQQWPIANPRPYEVEYGLPTNLTMGEQLLRNTAERKYCRMVGCQKRCEPFDPTNPNSPTITYYDTANCIPICDNFSVSALDNDPVMNRMLDNPRAAAGTLINMCNTAKNKGVNLNGTRLGQFCNGD